MTTIFKNIIENEPAIIPYTSHKVAPIKLTDLSFSMSFIKKDPITTNVAIQPTISRWFIFLIYLFLYRNCDEKLFFVLFKLLLV